MLTKEDLTRRLGKARPDIIQTVLSSLTLWKNKYDINTDLRMAHFLAQLTQETDGLHTLEEYASGRAYEMRSDLGNIYKGDGARYKGRGGFMLTGRANYKTYGKKLGVDLENHPELAADPSVWPSVSAEYWKTKDLNKNADYDNILGITKRINGGYNGLEDRKRYLKVYKELLGVK